MTRDQKIYRLAYWFASFIIAATLLSGYHKILHPTDFVLTVYRYHLLPDVLVNPVALFIPWLELVTALALLFVPRLRVAALGVAMGLLLLFTAGIAINLLRGNLVGCGCFSNSPTAAPMSWLSVARNTGLFLLTVLALLARRRAVDLPFLQNEPRARKRG